MIVAKGLASRIGQAGVTGAGRLLASAATLAIALGGPCAAGDITYNVTEKIGAGTVKGDIVTDGKSGVLSTADIVNWNLQLTGVGASTTLTSVGGASAVLLEGGDVTATSTKLLFNFSGADAGYLLFQANPGVFSGTKYFCVDTTSNVCNAGASVVPGSVFDSSAQFELFSGDQVIGTAGPVLPSAALEASVLALVQARIAQILVGQLESQLLVGLNEQVSCGNCGGASVGFGSFALSGHGRYALTPEWTLLGGMDVGQYRQKGANVDLNVGAAGALQYDPAGLGPSRPYVEVGLNGSLQNTRYDRSYPDGSGVATGSGSTRSYDVTAYAEAGWVDRMTPRDEAAIYASYSHTWQIVGGYAEQTGVDNPFNAIVPGGTDNLDVASLNAQYTHLASNRVELDVNGGVDRAFSLSSGAQPIVAGIQIAQAQPAFTYYQAGARIGYRLNRSTTADVFVNGILAPKAIGSSAHVGFGARWSF